jgi:hypothetical protein
VERHRRLQLQSHYAQTGRLSWILTQSGWPTLQFNVINYFRTQPYTQPGRYKTFPFLMFEAAVTIIRDDSQEEPPLVFDETTSQKTRRVPVTYIERNSNSNSSSETRRRRHNTADGTIITIKDSFPQQFGRGYILDTVGSEGSFVYMIALGLDVHHNQCTVWLMNSFHV